MKKEIRTIVYDDELRIEAYRSDLLPVYIRKYSLKNLRTVSKTWNLKNQWDIWRHYLQSLSEEQLLFLQKFCWWILSP